ncbi:LOW QUALITY PROTEIN: hypothetical protein ACHAXT_004852 [Thalassiosira profunda]
MAGGDVSAAVGLYLELEGNNGLVVGDVAAADASMESVALHASADDALVGPLVDDEDGAAGEVAILDDSADSEPSYGHLAEEVGEGSPSETSEVPSSPDYDHLALDMNEPSTVATSDNCGRASIDPGGIGEATAAVARMNEQEETTPSCGKETVDDAYYYAEVEDDGEEYILGTLMVRVLQAKNLKSNPHSDGGGIGGLLSKHRRQRHASRPTASPAGGGSLTPSANQQSLYAALSFREQAQRTSLAYEGVHGEYHWSRSEQSYFDVNCPGFPLKMGKVTKAKQSSASVAAAAASVPTKGDVSCGKTKNSQMSQSATEDRNRMPPLLQLSLYSKKPGAAHKQNKWDTYLKDDVEVEKNDDCLLGQCSINVLRILSGRTPYFDEWCTLHNERVKNSDGDDAAGRVRIVIEYEPTDPPPRAGDVCVFAHVHPLVDELYPIPLRSTVRPVRSSTSMSTFSSASLSSAAPSYVPTLRSLPKTFRVEEVVGDHVVLSYTTPKENWHCTFEVHRFLLLCVERHQAVVEKYKERALDLADNLSQSPFVECARKTAEALPDEGLLYVGAELALGGADRLGHWWQVGLDGMIEDVVDGVNLDGRYSHLSDDEEEEAGAENAQNPLRLPMPHSALPPQPSAMSEFDPPRDDRKALPGMPSCPITGMPMIEPVVAADGHTYERHAIARWLHTSDKSPLTGEVLAHGSVGPELPPLVDVRRAQAGGR